MKRIIFLMLGFLSSVGIYAQNTDPEFLAYIQKYYPLAQKEMLRTGIPASIKLAQAILESNAGRSELARKSNNHFSIKCHSNWTGPRIEYYDDDKVNDVLVKSCFRVYPTAEGSFMAHSNFLQKNRYEKLFNLDPLDYTAWAQGLQDAGYATSKTYASQLISLIERYELYQYDHIVTEEEPNVVFNHPLLPEITPSGEDHFSKVEAPSKSTVIYSVNEVRYVEAQQGQTLDEIAKLVDSYVHRLLKYNPRIHNSKQPLEGGQRVFLEPKRRAYKEIAQYHEVKLGEDLYTIADKYGLKYSKLLDRNLLEKGMEPAIGALIKLRGSKVKVRPLLKPSNKVIEEKHEILDDEILSQLLQNESERYIAEVHTQLSGMDQIAENNTIKYHRIIKDDTLWALSRKYGTTVEQLKKWNKLSDNTIRKGSMLRIH